MRGRPPGCQYKRSDRCPARGALRRREPLLRPGLDFHRHSKLNPLRCQRISIAGWTITRVDCQSKKRLSPQRLPQQCCPPPHCMPRPGAIAAGCQKGATASGARAAAAALRHRHRAHAACIAAPHAPCRCVALSLCCGLIDNAWLEVKKVRRIFHPGE